MGSSLEERVKRRKKSRGKRLLAIIIVFLVFLAIVGASYYWFDSTFYGDKKQKAEQGMMVAENKVTLMIMGVDRREDDVGRSDTLMVATIDPAKKAAAILSIPRDTRVKITGHGYDKINHAYAYGGHKLTQASVENLLGVPMDYYVLIDTKAFERIIDAIGGIDINVERRMYYEDPWDDDGGLVIDFQPGMQHMDGKKAIEYVRYRDEEGDIGRISRQQKFIRAVMDKVVSPSIIMKLPTIITEISNAVETDMSVSKMLSLAGILKDAKERGLNAEMVPGKPAYISDVSYWLPDVVKLRKMLAELLDVKMDDKIASAMKREAEDYEVSIPKEMKIVESEEERKRINSKSLKKDTEKNKPSESLKTKESAANRQGERSKEASPKQNKAAVPSVIQVEIVNASGVDGAGAEVASILKRQGFVVTGVSTMTAPYKNTVVITNTSSDEVVGKFSALPFSYSLQVNQSDGDAGSATVVIGKDYR